MLEPDITCVAILTSLFQSALTPQPLTLKNGFKTYNDFTVFFSIPSALPDLFSRIMTSTVIMTAAATTTIASTPARAAVADDDEFDDVVSFVPAQTIRDGNRVKITLTIISGCGEGGGSVPSWMEDCECDVIASATAQVSDDVAVSCDGATSASLSLAGCSSPPASQSPADLRASGASRQGPGEGDADCGSCSVHYTVLINFWLTWSWH